VVAIFIVDAGFIDWCSLIAIVMPLPDSGTSVIATAFSGTRAARSSAATLSGSTGGTVDCAWPGAASTESMKQPATDTMRAPRASTGCSKEPSVTSRDDRGATAAIIRTNVALRMGRKPGPK
jgi:hypothetical protein